MKITSVVVHALNDSTVAGFVDDTTPFEQCSKECFDELDLNADGVLSKEELRSGFGKLLPGIGYVSQPKEELNGLHDEIFERFDADQNGVVDRGEFKELLREIMLGVARGIGGSPVLVALEHGSLLMRAAQHEQNKG
ncbi:hypothetical protein ABKV19_022225 [Rosa sericea]|uniref:uncharacterized protein LOC133722339 n=1 Tax=Rosa rugosa TaxID=74645 RepID=UPI002B40F9C1|nr:uncharacterized protein LOC133722339 [Rosa rugosa]